MVEMNRLIDGHRKFLTEVFPQKRDHFHLLAESQAPEWLFITCSDSRIVPDLILGPVRVICLSRAMRATWCPLPVRMLME